MNSFLRLDRAVGFGEAVWEISVEVEETSNFKIVGWGCAFILSLVADTVGCRFSYLIMHFQPQ